MVVSYTRIREFLQAFHSDDIDDFHFLSSEKLHVDAMIEYLESLDSLTKSL